MSTDSARPAASVADLQTEITAGLNELLTGCNPATADPAEFLGRQFDLGLAWIQQPRGLGGLAAPPELQSRVDQALAQAGAPKRPNEAFLGLGMCAPAIARHGSPEQCRALLRPIFTAEKIWCQLFSEPGAGSDLAGLSTRATPEGDDWVIDGQKVWTTFGHLADFGLLLARTDPDLPKHRGLTAFVLDMKSPGVEVRPLFQLTGEAEFNQIYLTDVLVPDSARLGARGDGWRIALTTLMNERVTIGAITPESGRDMLTSALHVWQENSRRDPVLRRRLVQLWIRAEVLCLTIQRAMNSGARGAPGPEGSIGKLQWAELQQDIAGFTHDLLGPAGALYPPGYDNPTPAHISPSLVDEAGYRYLRTRANTIEGGTSDIMRNILAERVLGLPEEPRLDKSVPWRETRHG